MKLTNKKGFSEPLVLAVQNDPYEKGEADYTTTGLIKPPQVAHLLRQHGDELSQDVGDMMYVLFGQAIHTILERAAASCPELVVEQRFYKTVLGKKVGGKIDLYDPRTKTLRDYKFVGLATFYDGVKPGYEAQANINAHLMRLAGFPVEHLELEGIYRDWKAVRAATARPGDDYPTQGADIFRVRMWPDSEAAAFIEARVRLHEAARAGNVAPCTPPEMWQEDPVYAVMKKGNKAAVRGGLKATKQEAELMAAQLGSQHYVQFRPGSCKNCEFFCPVRSVCPQRAAMKQGKQGESDNGENE